MRFLIAIVGIWLAPIAAVCASGAPDDRYAGPAMLNVPSAAPIAKPKVVDYGGSAANTLRSAVTELRPPVQSAAAADLAPDPPREGHTGPAPAILQREPDSPPIRLASAIEPAAEETKPCVAIANTALPASRAAAETIAPITLGGHADKAAPAKSSPLGAMFTVSGSLSVVLGLFLVVAWAMRKTAPRGSLALPKEVFEILGRAALGSRQQVQLLRCGNKLLLVSITPHGTETLTEVTDPLEVDRIAGICQQANPKSSTKAFRQVFQQLAAKPAATESGNVEIGGVRRKRDRWEEKNA